MFEKWANLFERWAIFIIILIMCVYETAGHRVETGKEPE